MDEVKAADTIIIGSPMYNFNIPASLKSWIDLIALVGHTLKYVDHKPVGLLSGKKVYVLIASGGTPLDSPYDHASPYLKCIFGVLGITDVTIIGGGNGVDKIKEYIAGL